MILDVLPTINATLNGLSAVLLGAGYVAIRKRNIPVHKACMIAAFVVSAVFLCCYVTYHYLKHIHTGQGHTSFAGTGWVRPAYFVLLVSHVILAIVNLPMVLITLNHAWRGRFDKHRKIARWTLPIWAYVSVTGVVVYLMLYHLVPVE